MTADAKSTLVVVLACFFGFVIGVFYQRSTDDHKLLMSEFKKNSAISNLVDTKILDAVKNYKKKELNAKE